ncbi:MAG: hypothetical protein JSV21_08545 [Nitrospirota bacterium]|nr:MAG: hypothetical protein JSV21_08545 [Nitrospirota bacterium]
MQGEKEKDYFERPGNIKKLWIALYVVCALTIVFELFIDRTPHFGIDRIFGFYALLGFVSCAILIIIAKVIGFILKKNEDYYD